MKTVIIKQPFVAKGTYNANLKDSPIVFTILTATVKANSAIIFAADVCR